MTCANCKHWTRLPSVEGEHVSTGTCDPESQGQGGYTQEDARCDAWEKPDG